MTIKLARELALPDDAITQTFGFVGKRGSGKTYGALRLAELMLGLGGQIVTLDPVGKWWALRLAADGKSTGFEIPVLGGHRGDLPLEPGAGALLADLVVDRRTSLVLDVSLMTQGELKRFAGDFAERLLARKKGEAHPSPLHLFLEEAQELVPQHPQDRDQRMAAAFVRLVKLGRNWGIGVTLISQRPQAVSKEALNQTECLVALQTVGAHERKALREWIRHQGEEEKLADQLPALASGEAFIWSPGWLGKLARVHISARSTFDASATPTQASAKGKAAAALGPIDLEALRGAMAATIERAQADDPEALRARVRALEKELAQAKRAAPAADPEALTKARAEGRNQVALEARRQVAAVVASAEAGRGRAARAIDQALEQLKRAGDALREPIEVPESPVRAGPVVRAAPVAFKQRTSAAPSPARAASPHPAGPPADGLLTGPEQRILDAIAWMESIGVEEPQQTAVAFLSGYSGPENGAYKNPRGALNQRGLVRYVPGGGIALTDEGRASARAPDAPGSAEELQERVLAKLPGPERKLLQHLLEAYPESLGNDDLAHLAGYSDGNNGAYKNPRGRLRSLGLISYPGAGQVVALPLLFLE